MLLKPLGSTAFVVSEIDKTGGSGANFIVEWVAEENVSEPIVQAVMIGAEGGQGISFVSPRRVIESRHE